MDFQPMNLGLARVDKPLSALAQSWRPVPKECFLNAIKAHNRLDVRTLYVEGWAVMAIAPLVVCHGWLETFSGRIVECTSPAWSAYYPVRRWAKPLPPLFRLKSTPLLDDGLGFELLRGNSLKQHRAAYRQELGIDLDTVLATLQVVGEIKDGQHCSG